MDKILRGFSPRLRQLQLPVYREAKASRNPRLKSGRNGAFALHKALPILAILLSSQSFAQFTLTKNVDNYKARKSTFQRWDGAATVQGQDTVYSTYRYCVNQGWHSVYIWANSADDSVDLMVQYQTVPDTVSPFIAKTIWTNIAALTDTQWIYPYQIYPVTSEFIRFRAYGGADNDASTGSAFNLDDYGWNIE